MEYVNFQTEHTHKNNNVREKKPTYKIEHSQKYVGNTGRPTTIINKPRDAWGQKCASQMCCVFERARASAALKQNIKPQNAMRECVLLLFVCLW